ncbi:MAG: peptidoglycan DD-metalloendopeptidase family protein [Deltaproteobacteria bacterium]|nr:peptidoglycan DD-metalloendopeptidase family protein [Deltaproteobacteria bacterium]
MIGETANYQVNLSALGGRSTGRLENQGAISNPESSKTRLKEAAKELEALFIYELLKEMRQTTQGGFLGKGLGNDIYNSLFDMEVARLTADRGLGLGEMLLKQLDGLVGKDPQNQQDPVKDPIKSSMTDEKKLLDAPPILKSPEKQLPDLGPESLMRLPVDGLISSRFGWRKDPFSGEEKFHSGIDIAAQSGKEIFPIKKGRVIFSGLTQGYGNTVVIDHGDGFISKYGHNLTNLVFWGDEVDKEQVIALVGNTGKSTGAHLHFEVQYNGKKINPLGLIQKETGKIG